MAGTARGASRDALHAKPEAITRVTVKKWGNSAAVRFPGSVMVAARVSLDQAVEVRAEDRRIIIEPVRPDSHDPASLVEAITDDNRHGRVETGAKRGAEAW